MDLACVTPTKYLAFQSLFLMAHGICGIGFNWVPEEFGRKKTIVATTFICLLFQVFCILTNNFLVRLACFTIMGMSQLKNGVLITYAFEINRSEDKSFVCSLINTYDMSIIILLNIYFIFVKNWRPFFYFHTLCGIFAFTVLAIFAPESPKWMII
jgi:MFS family permease